LLPKTPKKGGRPLCLEGKKGEGLRKKKKK